MLISGKQSRDSLIKEVYFESIFLYKDNFSTLNLSYFISKRINMARKESIASTIHRIAIASIAVGVAASVVAFLILKGFQDTVKEKIFSFGGHLMVTKFTMNNSMEGSPMDYNIPLYRNYSSFGFIDHVQEYAFKPGVIKTDDEALGIFIKGVGKSYDLNRFSDNMKEGRFIDFPDSGYSNEVLLSSTIAAKLNLSVGDNITVHFLQNPPRLRRLNVVGIYETNLSEFFDSKIIIGDIRLIARLNDWADSIAGGLEVFVKDINNIEAAAEQLGQEIDFDQNIQPVSERYIQVFDWLHLLSRQVNILLGIILAVVSVNMISVVLILVMERTTMIGMLKALGANNALIRSVFVYSGINLMLKGLLVGNGVAILFCYLQDRFRIIKLNPSDYYMSFVPVSWQVDLIIMVNVITFVIVGLVLFLPTAIISRINPIKAIRFD